MPKESSKPKMREPTPEEEFEKMEDEFRFQEGIFLLIIGGIGYLALGVTFDVSDLESLDVFRSFSLLVFGAGGYIIPRQ